MTLRVVVIASADAVSLLFSIQLNFNHRVPGSSPARRIGKTQRELRVL
jgi:hypothetical protein